jgi:hypothetical protein
VLYRLRADQKTSAHENDVDVDAKEANNKAWPDVGSGRDLR